MTHNAGKSYAIAVNYRTHQGNGDTFSKQSIKLTDADLQKLDDVAAALKKLPAVVSDAPPGPTYLGVLPAERPQPETVGVHIPYILPDGPAAAAGLPQGCVVVRIDGVEMDSARKLREVILAYKPGDQVKITYYNLPDKVEREVTATLDEL